MKKKVKMNKEVYFLNCLYLGYPPADSKWVIME